MSQNKNISTFMLIFALGFMSVYAGTTDNLGLASTWATVAGWFGDGYIMKIISFLLLVFAITLAIMKQYLYAIIILIMTVILSNLNVVVEKFASATF